MGTIGQTLLAPTLGPAGKESQSVLWKPKEKSFSQQSVQWPQTCDVDILAESKPVVPELG